MKFRSKNLKDVPGKNLCDLLVKFANIYTTETIIGYIAKIQQKSSKLTRKCSRITESVMVSSDGGGLKLVLEMISFFLREIL